MNALDKKINFNEERRVAARHKVNLKASVIITAVGRAAKAGKQEEEDDDDAESYLILQGQLLDVSRTGLALIISNADARELGKLADDLVFRLLLPLPAQAIELEAVPVRRQRLETSKTGRILVGASITNMSGRDRVLFMDFIDRFEDGK